MNQQLSNIPSLHCHDILCGKRSEHEGNKYFRSLVKELKYAYVAAPKRDKPVYARLIVEKIRSLNPPGRFLRQSPVTGLYDDIGDKDAITKTRQALREGAPEIEKQLIKTGVLGSMSNESLPHSAVCSNQEISSSVNSRQPIPSSSLEEPIEGEANEEMRHEDGVALYDFLAGASSVEDDVGATRQMQHPSCSITYTDVRSSSYDAHEKMNCAESINFNCSQFNPRESPCTCLEENNFRSSSIMKMSLCSMRSSNLSNLMRSSLLSYTLENEIQDERNGANLCSMRSSDLSNLMRSSLLSYTLENELQDERNGASLKMSMFSMRSSIMSNHLMSDLEDDENDATYYDEKFVIKNAIQDGKESECPPRRLSSKCPPRRESSCSYMSYNEKDLPSVDMNDMPQWGCHDDAYQCQDTHIEFPFPRRRSSLIAIEFASAIFE